MRAEAKAREITDQFSLFAGKLMLSGSAESRAFAIQVQELNRELPPETKVLLWNILRGDHKL